jgi:hypothetical protein
LLSFSRGFCPASARSGVSRPSFGNSKTREFTGS